METVETLSLFDPAESRQAALKGMYLSAEAAGERYQELGLLCLRKLAGEMDLFTADDFWRDFEPMLVDHGFNPQERRDASGAIFQAAYRLGIIERTGATRKSERVAAHGKELPVLTGGARAPAIGSCTSYKTLETIRERAQGILAAEERTEEYPSGKFVASYGELYAFVKSVAES